MKIGNKEGMNRIYQKSGEPLFRKGEKIDDQQAGTWLGYYVKKGLKFVSQYKTFRGTFYITDYRIFFISNLKTIKGGGSRGVAAKGGGQLASFAPTKEITLDYRDFFEINYVEIKKINPTAGVVEIYGKDKNHKYRVDVNPDTEEALTRAYSIYQRKTKA